MRPPAASCHHDPPLETGPAMHHVVRRLVERRNPQLVMAASVGDQEMTHTPALRGCFPCWRADAGLPSNGLRPARRQGVADGAMLRSALEQRGGHKIILPSLAVVSPRTCSGSVAELAASDVEPLLAVGVKRRCSGQCEDGMHLCRSDLSRMVIGYHDLGFERAFAPPRSALHQLLCLAGSVPGRSSGLPYAAGQSHVDAVVRS
jgi:hypothetical protein